MISLSKALLIALYSSALTAAVYGKRTSIAEGEGAGSGSRGRLDSGADSSSGGTSNNYASNSGGSTTTTVVTGASSSSSGSTTTTVSTGASSSNSGSTTTTVSTGASSSSNNSDQTNEGENTGNVSVTTTTSNVGSSANFDRDQQIINNLNNANNADNGNGHPGDPNWSDGPWFIGTTGSLAQRTENVLCPICDAVPDKFYNENLKIDVKAEDGLWTCGYLQESVQDVDQYSMWMDNRQMCRQSQIHAENGGCCAQTMYINTPGDHLNNPCDLCGEWPVPYENLDILVDTHVVGKHTCGGIQFAMQHRVFSANMCPAIRDKIKEECCTWDLTSLGRGIPEEEPKPLPFLRGGVVP